MQILIKWTLSEIILINSPATDSVSTFTFMKDIFRRAYAEFFWNCKNSSQRGGEIFRKYLKKSRSSSRLLKVHWCRFENLPVSSNSCIKIMPWKFFILNTKTSWVIHP